MAKYQSYAEYKDSGVEWLGNVPQHWALVPCRAVVDHIVEKILIMHWTIICH